jgi:anaerobic selenocysteine-containing dehydrogenase
MNEQQKAELGLRRGDVIYVKSKRGWSGFYEITDNGCAYGTIDIYVKRGEIPKHGVEYNVSILIGDEVDFQF